MASWPSPACAPIPFFFDLLGFLGSVKGQGTRTLNDGNESDFFVGLNTLAIVVELPNASIGGTGTNVGVWATTRVNGMQADQMGRPAINTVFNGSTADKEAFNVTAPAAQPTAMGGKFRNNVIGVLLAFSAGDTEGDYTTEEAGRWPTSSCRTSSATPWAPWRPGR